MRKLCARAQMWPMRGTFRISRGARTETPTVIAEIEAKTGLQVFAMPKSDEYFLELKLSL